MKLTNSTEAYGGISILLHWVMALIVVGMLALGLYMTSLPDGDPKWEWYSLHKSFGMLVFLLAMVRLTWMASHPRPELPGNLHPWEKAAARVTHALLYLAMFLLPLSGYLDSCAGDYHLAFFELFDVPKLIPKDKELEELSVLIHSSLAYGLIALLILHLGAVAKHQFVLKDETLRRMLP